MAQNVKPSKEVKRVVVDIDDELRINIAKELKERIEKRIQVNPNT